MLNVRRTPRGFTLVELTVVLVMASVLALFALPSFDAPLRKSRRQTALAALTAAQLRLEDRRARETAYDARVELAALSRSPAARHYAFDAGAPAGASTATSYSLSATAQPGSTQARDAGCQHLRIDVIDGLVTLRAGSDAAATTDDAQARTCWGVT